ncbi:MAG: SMP-30/gluconolactonase/LRE family protein [Pseudomonadota bacterium]|nr:SMP-30/gluconolactonase/LRE family protein [Pseudomonadota bacterium]
MTKEYIEVTNDLKFPEGPIYMPDGTIILVEIAKGTLTRVNVDGSKDIIADLGGGPNGAAIGPDGCVYVCNNGGFEWHEIDGLLIPGAQGNDYSGGRIEKVDLKTGSVDVIYTECDGNRLKGPNDIVFDKDGGFWFTDLGKTNGRVKDQGALFYAKIDGTFIKEVVFPIESANGVGLSPNEDVVYVADTTPGRLWGYPIIEPGVIDGPKSFGIHSSMHFIHGSSELALFDSLAVDSEGWINVATIFKGGITRISPDKSKYEFFPTDDLLTTNICFGGDDLKTAYITLSSTGRLVKTDWDVAGHKLNF